MWGREGCSCPEALLFNWGGRVRSRQKVNTQLCVYVHGAGKSWLQTPYQPRTPNPEPRTLPLPLPLELLLVSTPSICSVSVLFLPSPCPSHFPALTPPVSAVCSARRAGRPRSRPWKRRWTSSTTPPPIRFSPPWRRRAAPCSSYLVTRAKPLIFSTRSEFIWEKKKEIYKYLAVYSQT